MPPTPAQQFSRLTNWFATRSPARLIPIVIVVLGIFVMFNACYDYVAPYEASSDLELNQRVCRSNVPRNPPAVAPMNSEGAMIPPLPPLPSVRQVASTFTRHRNESSSRIFIGAHC
jgi:hypothetical protein